jgi:hypothetical protein
VDTLGVNGERPVMNLKRRPGVRSNLQTRRVRDRGSACVGPLERTEQQETGVVLPNPRCARWGVEPAKSNLCRFGELQSGVANLWRRDTEAWVKRPFPQRFTRL